MFSGEDNIKTEEPKQEQAKPAEATEVIHLKMKCMNCPCWIKSSMLFCLFVSELIKGLGSWLRLDSMPRRGRQIPLNSIAWFHQEDGIRDN